MNAFSIFGNPTILERLEDCPCSHDLDLQLQSLQVLHLPRRMFGGCYLNLQKQTGWHLPNWKTTGHTSFHITHYPSCFASSMISVNHSWGGFVCEWWKPHGKTAQPNHCSPRLSLHPNGLLRVAGSALWCDSVICDQDAATWQHTQKSHISNFQSSSTSTCTWWKRHLYIRPF